ncbi:fatty acid--CoA ligase [Paraburkholderia sabiae]|uniref:Fatty acid--CoA ligase n=1 Tax=Paraburkholderia sabiae TaxID=273251 RepID=A0ABU9Q8H8_9BURK|nr:fatty acid--CoA ligase [Paraburkholderia sabiae]WJZ78289.1 fatty acid--CoA ligase [Paraburkholderia sabiae]CAD6506874.1 Long-chain-fatty-acid--CoA ligase [Paraburkholderia sabiae]
MRETETPDHLITAAASAYAYPLLVKQLLVNSLSVRADQEITYRGELRYTFAAFHRRVGQLANALASLGVRAGSTVAVMDWDTHRYLESYFAIPMMGATIFTVNVRISAQQIAYTLNDARADVLIVNSEFLPVLEAIRGELKHVREVIVASDDTPMPSTSFAIAGEYEQLVSSMPEDFAFEDFDENTRAAIFYTTGTTGDPKGVCYSHRQIVLHTLATATTLCSPRTGQRLHRDDVYMPITPMFHVLAWGMPYIAVMLGLKIVLPGRYQPDTLLHLKKTERVTFSHCVPTILQMLLDAAARDAHDLSGWTMIIGGSALSPSMCRAALEQGIDVFAGYGMSETGPVAALSQFAPDVATAGIDESVRKRCMTGRPVPMVELRVVDAQMNDVPRDGRAQGEIVLRSPYLTPGYHNKPEASEALWEGGYLHTQDVAVMTPDGYVQIVDRIKDVIKTGGEWVSSIEIEALINELHGVEESAVIGVQDERWGERPKALIVLRPHATLDAQAVRAHLLGHADAKRISRYAVPEAERVIFVAAIPKTSVGKIDKKLLRQRFE